MIEQIATDKQLINVAEVVHRINLQPGEHVADLGCGATGTWVFASARAVGDKGRVYACDIMKSVLKAMETRAHTEGIYNISTVWTNLEVLGATKIPPASLDAALLINTLYQSTNREAMIKEGIRLTKSGGRLVIIDWKKDTEGFGPPQDKRVNPEQMKQFALQNGLKLIQNFAAGKYHFALVFQK